MTIDRCLESLINEAKALTRQLAEFETRIETQTIQFEGDDLMPDEDSRFTMREAEGQS